jgi:hypothetical protein
MSLAESEKGSREEEAGWREQMRDGRKYSLWKVREKITKDMKQK